MKPLGGCIAEYNDRVAYFRVVLAFCLVCTVHGCGSKVDSSDGGSSEGVSSSGEGSDDTDISLECSEKTDEATRFIEQNNACETMLDCTQAEALCYHGPMGGPCGGVGLSVDADLGAWRELMVGLEQSCECGAPPCGSNVMCNEQGWCESLLFSEDFCQNVERDIQTFLSANRSCQTAADCVSVPSTCHVDDCSAVVLNVDADVQGWQRLDEALAECEADPQDFGRYCNYVGECAFNVLCTDEGQCAAQR